MPFLEIKDPEKRDFLVQEFLKTKNNVRQNFLAEKMGDIGIQRELTKLYRPITESQATQSATLAKELNALKESTSSALKALPASLASIMPPPLKTVQFPLYPSIQAETDEVRAEGKIELGPIATKYLRSSMGEVDKTFGLHDRNGQFEIGDTKVTLSGDDVIIGESEFVGTPGLWELLTSKNPDKTIYTTDDLDDYETILLNTNAIVNPKTGRVKSSSSTKYRNIIKPIYDQHLRPKKTSTTGKGIALMPSDPNALIDMLDLRFASYNAGNSGVRNEIIELAEELLRQGVIDKEAYKKLMLPLKNVD